MQFQYRSLINLPKTLEKKAQTTKITKKWSFLITLNSPAQQSCLYKTKIGDAATYDIYFIMCSLNINHP